MSRTVTYDSQTLLVSQRDYDALLARLDEPPRELPKLRALIESQAEWLADATGFTPDEIDDLGGI